MFWLGLILPISYVAGVTGATIPTQYPLLSIALAPMLWRRGRTTAVHWIGAAFVAYAALSVAWSPHPMFAIYGMWGVALWALAFWMGSTSPSLLPLWRGLTIGLTISSFAAINQISEGALLDLWLPSADPRPAGLLFNPAVQGIMIALVCVALICEGKAFYIPPMLPGLFLAQSRGAFLVLCIGIVVRYINLATAAVVMTIAAAVALAIFNDTDALRLADWGFTVRHLTPIGFGAGSFMQVVYGNTRLEYAHNDYLQFAFEYGIGAIPLYLVIAACLSRTAGRHWPVFVAFCSAATFFFPFFNEPLAFVGAVVAGHLLRGLDSAWPVGALGGFDLMARLYGRRRRHACAGGKAFSVPSRNSAETIGALDAPL